MSETRYFKTGNCNRPYKTKGFSFEFERLEFQNGTWLGALAVEDEDQAKALAKFGAPVEEIKEAEYAELKKKLSPTSPTSEISEPTPTEPKEETAPAAVESLEDELDFKTPPASDEKTLEESGG